MFENEKWQINRGCSEKIRYYTRAEAKRAIRKDKRRGWNNHIYKCRYCGKYHLTSQVK